MLFQIPEPWPWALQASCVTATNPVCMCGDDAFQNESRVLHWWETLLYFQFSNRRLNLDYPVTLERPAPVVNSPHTELESEISSACPGCSPSGKTTDIFPFHNCLVWVILTLRLCHQLLPTSRGRSGMQCLLMNSLSQDASGP